jgi:hypothetical protein
MVVMTTHLQQLQRLATRRLWTLLLVFLIDKPSRPKLKKLNSVAVVRKRTIPTERPQLVGEVSANLYGQRVLRGQRNEFPRPLISVF